MDTIGSTQPANLSTAIDVLNDGLDRLQQLIFRLDANADRIRGWYPVPTSAQDNKSPAPVLNGEFDKLLQATSRFEGYVGDLENSVIRHEGI